MTIALSPIEQVVADKRLAELVSNGYVQQDAHKHLTVGARIRHVGQQYGQAHEHGTGNIWAVLVRHEADIELVVVYDEPRFEGGSRVTVLADYHGEVVL